MSKASFMSMKWLRLHIKEIIWATVILFVGSIFVIGYGTSRQIQQQEERRKQADDAEALQHMIPRHLQDKVNLPVAHVSYPSQNASLTTVIDVKTVWRAIKDAPEYQQLQSMPEGIKDFYGNMLKDRALESLISMSLLDLYARANNIRPQVTAQALVDQDRQQISAVEFERKLRRDAITAQEYGEERLRQLTFQTVATKVMAPVPPASATEDFLKSYYQANIERFQLDDQISFDHLLISPADYTGKAEITDEQIKNHFDTNRSSFVSSKRISASHIVINPNNVSYLESINVSDSEVRRRYADNLSSYRDPEKVQARHILIKPKNIFDLEFPGFKVNLRNFNADSIDEKVLFTFDAGLGNLQSSTSLDHETFTLVTADGKELKADEESMKNTENALELPMAGSTKAAAFGKIGFMAEKDAVPVSLLVRDGSKVETLDISAAFDTDKAFDAAKAEIEKLMARIEAGEDFAALAEKHSQDPGSKVKGGDLGEFARGAMVKPFEDLAFTSAIGKVAGPVKTQYGYHIIKVEGKTPERVKSLEDVKIDLIKEIRAEQADLRASSTLESVRQKVFHQSEDFASLAKLHSMGPTRKDGGKLPIFFKGEITDDYSAQQKQMLIEEIGDESGSIIKELENVIFNLAKGETSEVIKTSKGYHIIKVEEILEPIQLALTESLKKQIHGILEKQTQEAMAKEAAEKLKSANPSAGVAGLVKAMDKAEKDESKVSFGPLPFTQNPGFSSYSLSDGAGKFSADGRTYLTEIHKTIANLVKDNSWKGKVAGPLKSELGYHFIEITSYEGKRVESFEEIKEKLRRMVTLEPSSEELQKAFEENIDQFDIPATRKIRQIVVAEEKVAAELYDRLTKGEIFALLASKYSIDGSSTRGGLTAPVKRGQLSENLDKAVWSLEKGQFSQPVKTPYGYVIALLEENESPGVKASLTADVTTQLKRKLRNDYQEEAWTYFLKGLNNKAYVIRHPEILSGI